MYSCDGAPPSVLALSATNAVRTESAIICMYCRRRMGRKDYAAYSFEELHRLFGNDALLMVDLTTLRVRHAPATILVDATPCLLCPEAKKIPATHVLVVERGRHGQLTGSWGSIRRKREHGRQWRTQDVLELSSARFRALVTQAKKDLS